MKTSTLPVLHTPADAALPDNDQWQFRFEVKSESSDRLYIVSQNKKNKHWGCSCPAWRTRRNCKHLSAMGIPGDCTPYEPKIIQQ